MPATKKIKPVWKKNPLPKAGDYINSVGISGDGQRVIGGSYFFDYSKTANHTTSAPLIDVGTFVWNAKGKLQWSDKFKATEGVYWVAISRDGSHAAACGLMGQANGFIFAYDATAGTKQLTYNTHVRVNMVALSGDGTYLVAGAAATYLFKRTGANWSAPQTIPCAAGDHVVAVGISDNGQWIVAGTYKGSVILVENNSGVLGAPVSWQQPGGTIHWVAMAADGSSFVAGGNAAKVFYFTTANFPGSAAPDWTATMSGCTRCGAVGISGNGSLVSAVGNSGTAGKVILYSNTGQVLWSKATLRNPNSTTLDDAGQFVTVADGYPDGTKGNFYLFDAAGNQQWAYQTTNMSWPMVIASDGSAIAAGSDDSHVYYFK